MSHKPAVQIESVECRQLFAAALPYDPAFGTGGSVTFDLPTTRTETQLLVDSHQRTIIVLATATKTELIRLTATGQIDHTFGTAAAGYAVWTDYTVGHDFNDGKIVLDSSDRLLLPHGDAITRLTTRGSVDRTFGTRGTITLDGSANAALRFGGLQVDSITERGDGGLWITGTAAAQKAATSKSAELLALTANGEVDTSYSGDGLYALPLPTAQTTSSPTTTLREVSGGFVVAAYDTLKTLSTYKFSSSGDVDTSYGTNGRHVYTQPSTIAVNGVTLSTTSFRFDEIRADGSVVISLFVDPGEDSHNYTTGDIAVSADGHSDGAATYFNDVGLAVGADPLLLEPDGSEIVGVQSSIDFITPGLQRIYPSGKVSRAFLHGAFFATDYALGTDGSAVIHDSSTGQLKISRVLLLDGPEGLTSGAEVTSATQAVKFSVTWRGTSDVLSASLDNRDLLLRHGQTELAARVTHRGLNADGSVTVTYQVLAPDGGWGVGTDGIYSIDVRGKSVLDAAGVFAAARTIGEVTISA